jgi:hypothetical protein
MSNFKDISDYTQDIMSIIFQFSKNMRKQLQRRHMIKLI